MLLVNDTNVIIITVVEFARSDDSIVFGLWTKVVFQTDALSVERTRCEPVAQLVGKRIVWLGHARLEQFNAVLSADGRSYHVAPARLELQRAYQCFPVRSQTIGRSPHFHVPT